MKRIIFLFFIMVSIKAVAQNYAPFKPGVLYDFSPIYQGVVQQPLMGGYAISPTIFIDSSFVQGNDTCYVNYKHIEDNPFSGPDFCHKISRNFWLGEKMIHQATGDFLFTAKNGDTTRLKTQVNVNDSFIFLFEQQHPDTFYLAYVISKQPETVRGITDSVITYRILRTNNQKQPVQSVSNFLEIKLSKSYGVLQWVIPENDKVIVQSYNNTHPQSSIYPSMATINQFETGDIFEYEFYRYNNQTRYSYQRREVIAKQIYGAIDSIVYTFEESTLFIPYKPQKPILTDTVTQVIYPITNPEQFFKSLGPYQWLIPIILLDTLGFSVSLHGGFMSFNDTCWQTPHDGMITSRLFKPGIGLISSVYPINFGDDAEIKQLYYYKKGNQTWGTSIDFNLKKSSRELEQQSTVSIYPNPVQQILTIEWNDHEQASLLLFDLVGKEVFSCKLQEGKNELSLSAFPPGVYFYSVQSPSGITTQGKIIRR
ncbi:MAG: T9SS type A sorting domain-containing protein [Bacteroidia bacterium]|nr:T9SS type A sorting domain-containing protein [Bacteroidia bacterium]